MAAATIQGTAGMAALAGLAGCAFLIARGRSRCAECGQTFYDPIFWRPRRYCTECRPVRPSLFARVLGWAAVGLCMGLVVFYLAVIAASGAGRAVMPRHATPATVIAMVVGYLLGRAGRTAKEAGPLAAFRGVVGRREGRDLRAARESAGTEGAVARAGKVAVWAEAGQAHADGLLATVQAIERKFVHLTGFDRPPFRLRLLAFEAMPGYGRYIASWGVSGPAAVPYFVLGRRRFTFAVSLQGAAEQADPPERTIGHFVAWLLTAGRLGYAARPWLVDGLTAQVLVEALPSAAEPAARQRRARAEAARGAWEPFERLATASWAEVSHAPKEEVAATARADALRFQSWALVRLLVEEHLAEFHAFLRTLRAMAETERPFAHAFGCTGDEALRAALERLADGDPPPHGEPPDALKWRIDTSVIPKVSADRPVAERCGAARTLGALGYLYRAEALIDLLTDEDEHVRLAARTALENIAGELHGDAPAAWRAWRESL